MEPTTGQRGTTPTYAALPFIDDHLEPFAAPRDAVWASLLGTFRRQGRASGRLARLLGCDPPKSTPLFTGDSGQTVPGFRVEEVEPERRLTLGGRHRFAIYRLTFIIDGDRLRALTHAAFPGALGKLYRAAVVGSGGHRFVTRRVLKHVIREATRRTRG
jgi:hypothetical protein